MKLTHLTIVAALIVAPGAVFGQNSTGATSSTSAQVSGKTIGQRKVDQQDRIGAGVRSGQLTAGETAHLERQEAGINREEKGMRAEDNGRLTAGDKKLLARQQNQESRRIYKDKHNLAKR